MSGFVILVMISSFVFVWYNRFNLGEPTFINKYGKLYEGISTKNPNFMGIYYSFAFFLRRFLFVIWPLAFQEESVF
jgi:hypothetical protein